MTKIVAPIVGVLVILSSGAPLAETTITYDRFKDRTVVVAKKARPEPSAISVFLVSNYEGSKPTSAPIGVIVNFAKRSRTWEYLKCHDVAFLADGKRIAVVGPTRHDGTAGSGFVAEIVSAAIAMSDAKTMSKATKVEAKICNTEYTFDNEDMDNLRDLVKAVTSK